MKQSAAKTLGVAVLGAAFAAVGAGAADAAPAAPDAAPALDAVGRAVSAEKPSTALPVARQAGPEAPATGLLGGMPPQDLPTRGATLNGMPVGA
ncbi:ATP-binding protein [Streptomyces sp. YIM B13518]|uniref:ATP-binding protein n=1 Tax=Streptomyces sp. YIM B13518 TaxID=3366316 RepID=UPI0036A374FE